MGDSPKSKKAWLRDMLLLGGIILAGLYAQDLVVRFALWYKSGYPEVVHVGPLETSFCPDLPTGLSFGMSREDVGSMMKKESEKDAGLREGVVVTWYTLKEYPNSDVLYANLGFVFVHDKLFSILILPGMHTVNQESADNFEDVLFDFIEELVKQYGPPHDDFIGNIPNARYDSVFLWEFANNALLVGPITVEGDGYTSFAIAVCPLVASGHYTLSSFY